MKFKADWLRSLVYGDGPAGYEVVQDEVIDTTRWSVVYSLVFRSPEGKFYSTSYSRGATEMQEERPFEYEDEVDCMEVKPVEKVITVYVAV